MGASSLCIMMGRGRSKRLAGSLTCRQPRRCGRSVGCSGRRSLPMILVDANLLVYAHVTSLSQHQPARGWFDSRLNGPTPVGLPWPTLLSFVRLVSNPRIFEHPQPISGAWNQVERWLTCPVVWIPQPTERHREVLGSLLTDSLSRSNLVPDAHLAALAIEHGLTLCSTDRDFARFQNLRWDDPLQPQRS